MGIIAMKYINTANLKRKGFSLSNGVAEPQSITMDSQIQGKKKVAVIWWHHAIHIILFISVIK
jgi:hypothetical protein